MVPFFRKWFNFEKWFFSKAIPVLNWFLFENGSGFLEMVQFEKWFFFKWFLFENGSDLKNGSIFSKSKPF